MAEGTSYFLSVENLGLNTIESSVYEGVNLHANKGQVIALLGSRGSGKTSLLLTLGGRMKFTEGSGRVAGFDLDKQYPQVRDISGITIIERVNGVQDFLKTRDILAADLALNGKPSNKEAVDAYMEEWGFTEAQNKQFCNLDTNEHSEFDLMLACTNDPELLLIDTLGEGMTHRRTVQLIENLRVMARMRQMCIIFCTHEYDLAQVADGVVVLDQAVEEQRLRAIKDRGDQAMCEVVGYGNGVHPAVNLKGSHARQKFDKDLLGTYPKRLADLFTGDALKAMDHLDVSEEEKVEGVL